jgi:hypothetical protein
MLPKVGVYSVLFVAVLTVFQINNVNYTYEDFKNYLSVLLTSSSMVFTLMGIWIAFLYPNALQRIVSNKIKNVDFSDSLLETRRLEYLVASVLKSAFVVMMIMFFYFLKLIVPNFEIYQNNIELIKSLALSFVLILGILQVEAILHVIYSNVMFINDLHNKRKEREADSDI